MKRIALKVDPLRGSAWELSWAGGAWDEVSDQWVRFDVKFQSQDTTPLILLQTVSPGARGLAGQTIMMTSAAGEARAVLHLPRLPRKFVVTAGGSGRVQPLDASITVLSPVLGKAGHYSRMIWPLISSPSGIRRVLGRGPGALSRFGVAGLRAEILREARDLRNDQQYRLWVELYDTLVESDRVAIRRRIEAMASRPRFAVVCDPKTTPRSTDSIQRQLYPDWRICPGWSEVQGHEWGMELGSGDVLAEHALYLVAEEVLMCPAADLIYSDEDMLGKDGRRCRPFFKPDWDPDFEETSGYLGGMLVRRPAVEMSSIREDWTVRHLSHVLYHRSIRGTESVVRRGEKGPTAAKSEPSVSLIVCTRDRLDLLAVVVDGILNHTDYPSIELLVVNNQSSQPETLKYFKTMSDQGAFRVIDYDQPFNFAAMNNLAARHARGDVLGFLNNDLEMISPDWLKQMVAQVVRPKVAAVGAKLVHADGSIQHAGVILGVGWGAGHIHKFLPKSLSETDIRTQGVRRFSAVTAACMLVRKEVFEELGGFDDQCFGVAFNDVDFCLRAREKGYAIVWNSQAELYHLESSSRGSDQDSDKFDRFMREVNALWDKWGDRLLADPYYNLNLTLEREDGSLAFPPRCSKPWQ